MPKMTHIAKFKFRHTSTLGEGHLSQRWRIWDPTIIFSEKKSTSLNATRLSRKIQNQDLREMKGINENGGFE